MSGFDLTSRLIWSLSGSGKGTTISANGNSGPLTFQPTDSYPHSPVGLGRVSDVLITVIATGVSGTTPGLIVTLNAFDDQGNLFGPLVSTPSLGTAGAGGAKFASGGRHAGAAGAYAVFSEWGQVAWALSGTTPSFTGVEICIYGQ